MASEQIFKRDPTVHEENLTQVFKDLKASEQLLDTLLVTVEGNIEAHKIVLSASSPFFKSLLSKNKHAKPMIFLKGVSLSCLQNLVNFMYEGEVSIPEEELTTFLEVAKDLSIRGLSQKSNDDSIQPTKRPKLENITSTENQEYQESPTNVNMIFYSNPLVKNEPMSRTNLTLNHPSISSAFSNVYQPSVQLEQTLADISEEATRSCATSAIQPTNQMTIGGFDNQLVHDKDTLLRLKPPSELLNESRARILENKSLGLLMCSACTFTSPVVANMQQHIQTAHFNTS